MITAVRSFDSCINLINKYIFKSWKIKTNAIILGWIIIIVLLLSCADNIWFSFVCGQLYLSCFTFTSVNRGKFKFFQKQSLHVSHKISYLPTILILLLYNEKSVFNKIHNTVAWSSQQRIFEKMTAIGLHLIH